GEKRRAIAAVEAARRLAPRPEQLEERDGILLADAYRGLGERRQEISILLRLFQANPAHFFMGRLAEAYEAIGARKNGEAWRLKDDPGRALLGKTAPDFLLPLASGGNQALSDVLRGRKAVLVNFWFYG